MSTHSFVPSACFTCMLVTSSSSSSSSSSFLFRSSSFSSFFSLSIFSLLVISYTDVFPFDISSAVLDWLVLSEAVSEPSTTVSPVVWFVTVPLFLLDLEDFFSLPVSGSDQISRSFEVSLLSEITLSEAFDSIFLLVSAAFASFCATAAA